MSNGSLLQVVTEAGTGRLSFTHFNRADVAWAVEESVDLNRWGALDLGTLLPPESLGDGGVRETITFDLNQPFLSFLVRVQLIAP